MHRVQSSPNPIRQQGGDDRNEEAKLKVSRQNDLNPRSIPGVPCSRCERFQIVLQMRLRPESLMVNPRNRTAANRRAKALRERATRSGDWQKKTAKRRAHNPIQVHLYSAQNDRCREFTFPNDLGNDCRPDGTTKGKADTEQKSRTEISIWLNRVQPGGEREKPCCCGQQR
jgi:hypothetical protein